MTKSRRLRWAGHAARVEEDRSAFKILTGKLTAKKSLGRNRRRWEDHIRMDLKEIGINTRFGSEQGLLESPCECGLEPPGSISHGVNSIFCQLYFV